MFIIKNQQGQIFAGLRQGKRWGVLDRVWVDLKPSAPVHAVLYFSEEEAKEAAVKGDTIVKMVVI